jgi:cold-inducible RNA-binding protein
VSTKLYVGNLSYSVQSSHLNQLFSRYGGVQRALVVEDQATGRSQGFGFVEMENADEAAAAREGLDGYQHEGHAWTVKEDKPRAEWSGFSGGRSRR